MKGPADMAADGHFEECWNADLTIIFVAAVQLVSTVIFLK